MKKKIMYALIFIAPLSVGCLFYYYAQHANWIDFDAAMSPLKKYTPALLERSALWRMVKNQYDKHIIQDPQYRIKPRIPKVLHRIWLGSPQPEKERQFEQTWLSYHPDWQYKLWTGSDIAQLGLRNQALYDATKNWGEKSDIARYEILYRFGGLYIDTDFECIKSFDILHHYCDFYAGLGYFGYDVGIYNGLIGAAPGHPILKACIEQMRRHPGSGETFDDIMGRTGPYYFTRCVLQNIQHGGANIVFPLTYFYPWPCDYREQNSPDLIKQWIKPETFAVHHWHVSWNGGKAS